MQLAGSKALSGRLAPLREVPSGVEEEQAEVFGSVASEAHVAAAQAALVGELGEDAPAAIVVVGGAAWLDEQAAIADVAERQSELRELLGLLFDERVEFGRGFGFGHGAGGGALGAELADKAQRVGCVLSAIDERNALVALAFEAAVARLRTGVDCVALSNLARWGGLGKNPAVGQVGHDEELIENEQQ